MTKGCGDDCKNTWIYVLGGEENAIAEAIYKHAPVSVDRLAGGNFGVYECTTVPFQRMCPVMIKIRLWRDCHCVSQTDAEALSELMAKTTDWSLNNHSLKAGDITSCSKLFIKAEFLVERQPLKPCPGSDYTNPVTGEDATWGTSSLAGLCSGTINCNDEYSQIFHLQEYEYPLFLEENIEIIDGCPSLSGGHCGC